MTELKRVTKEEPGAMYYLKYEYTPDIVMYYYKYEKYEYFTSKQSMLDRKKYLSPDCRIHFVDEGKAYFKNNRLIPSYA